MRAIPAIRLSKALPMLVIGSFGLLLLFSIFYQHRQMLQSIETQSLEDVRRLLANTEVQVETQLRHDQHDLIAEEIAGFGVDTSINSFALIDDAGRVMHATRLDWIGRDFRDALPDFDVQQVNAAQIEHNGRIWFSADRQRILGYQPFVMASEPGRIRPTKMGFLAVDYDISRDISASWSVLIQSTYPIWAFGLILMLIMGVVISVWLDRPLKHLTGVVKRFSAGDYGATARLTGKGELSAFGEAWNRMSKELAETIGELEESKERLAVTLFSIGDAVVATDVDSRITFLNDVAQTLTGWTDEEAFGKPLEQVFNIINAQTRQPSEAPVKRVLATGQIMGLANHTVLISRDGAEYQIADSAAPIRNRQGEILGVVLVFRDVTEEYALRESLLNERTLLKSLIDAVPDLIFYKDCNSIYLGCNKAFEKFAGRAEHEQTGKTDFDFFDTETAEFFRQKDIEMLERGGARTNEEWVTYPDGRQVLLDTVKTPFYSSDGKLQGLVGVSRDVTERKRFEEKLAESEERIRSLGNNLPNGYIYQYAIASDGAPGFEFISAGVEKVHGVKPEQVLNNPMTLLGQIDSAQIGDYKEAESKSARELSDFSMELLLHHPGGGERWINVCSRPRRIGELTVWDGVAIDITEKKLSEEQIWRQANFDALTGLPNRRMFYDRLEQEVKKVHRHNGSFALFFIDLDRFKEVNDTLGHGHGDKLLQIAAKRLHDCVRDTDIVSRLGGDEFTIILSDLENAEIVERIAQTILTRMAEPFPLNGEQSFVSASIGITLCPTDSSDSTQLIKNADQAMYSAKEHGRNCYSYFTASMQEAAQYRLNMTHELRDALVLQQFQVFYQPIVELATGRINKAEALIRWNHPTKGLISPVLFIPVAEDSGLIHEIGDWVFKEAARQTKIFCKNIHPSFQISINKSPVQFRHASSAALNWLSYLETLGLGGESIVVEITEGLLLDASPNTSEKLLAFRDAGIQVSLDDFGTGYSSLSYIQKFDIDYLKIDRTFVCNLSADSTDMALCEAMILMAHKLGIKVIAEGIETTEQRDLLIQAGCDYGQGYLFSRPVPAEAFEKLLLAG